MRNRVKTLKKLVDSFPVLGESLGVMKTKRNTTTAAVLDIDLDMIKQLRARDTEDRMQEARIDAILAFKNWTGLSTRELFLAGRLGNDPTDYVTKVCENLYPSRCVEDLATSTALVKRAVGELTA